MSTLRDILEKLIEPICAALTDDAARQLLSSRPDPGVQAWMAEMAAKANEGQLSADERANYEYTLTIGTVVAVVKSKARASIAAGLPTAEPVVGPVLDSHAGNVSASDGR